MVSPAPAFYPVFLSVVLPLKNQAGQLESLLTKVSHRLCEWVGDHEIIIVDNASDDSSLSILKTLTSTGGLPNLQVYALTKEVDENLAAWVGLENALGDFVAVLDPLSDDIDFLPTMLEQAVSGADVVFASNLHRPPQGLVYRTASWAFNALYKRLNGISLSQDAPGYRLLGRHVINFILQFPQPSIPYRHLPATGGFTRVNLSYQSPLPHTRSKKLGESINHGMRLLVSSTQAPMRLVTGLSLFGAVINLLYTFYVLAVGLLKTDIASGWISLSLQQSGMFFLISLVLLVLGEYILNMASLSNEGPRYHVGQEMSSTRITRKEKLNIETSAAPSFPAQT